MSIINLILFLPRLIWKTIQLVILGLKMTFSSKSYLVLSGYTHSKVSDSLRNKDGDYIPWMNYTIIKFLDERLNKNLSVFEYGSGSSTMYFAGRVKDITSVEYDDKWFKVVSDRIKNMTNAQVHFIELNDAYPKSIANTNPNKKYDLVIVDGRRRVESAIFSFDYLTDQGVVILDDTARPHYQGAFKFYRENGYNELTYEGLKPTGFGMDKTTIFYKCGNNCLGL